MDALSGWDVAILAVAGYIAVTALVRLMLIRRNTLAGELRAEIEAERKRQQKAAAQKPAAPARPAPGSTVPRPGRPAA